MNTATPVARAEGSRFDQSRHLDRRPISLRSIGDSLRRRWMLIAAIVAACLVLAVLAALVLTPKYDAYAKVRITPNGRSALDFDTTTQTQTFDPSVVNSEVQVMGSRDMARRVVMQLGLFDDPEFVKPAKTAVKPSPATRARAVETATTTLVKNTNISHEEKSYVVQVGYRSTDPVKAAQIADTLVETYVNGTADALVGTATRQSTSIQNRLRDLGAEVEQAETRLAQYRAQAGITPGGEAGTVTDQQIAPLSSQLATVESEAAAARSNVAVAESQIAAGGTDAISAVLSSAVIADLRKQRTEAEKHRAELSSRYGPRYPLSIQVSGQIESLDEQIKLEARRIVAGLRSEARAAEARASSLRGQLNGLKGNIARDSRASVQASSLEREAEAKRTAYTRLAQAAQQSTQAQQTSEPQAKIIEQATIPSRASFPNVKAMFAAALLFGFALGCGTVLVIEGLRGSIRNPEDIELMLGIPFVAAIPRLRRNPKKVFGGQTISPADTLITKPMTIYAEAFRTIRSFIVAKRTPGSPSVIALASTLPGEGKTTSTLSLARIMALSGDRVLLIDCDLRRAGLARALKLDVPVGLAEVLSGEASYGDAIVADVTPNLSLLPVKQSLFTSTDLFGGTIMTEMLAELKTRYDFILLDTPPLLGIADSKRLTRISDAVMLLVKWDSTPVAAVDAALSGLEQDDIVVLGAILSMVDHRSEAMGAHYYSSRYSAYYEG